MTVHCDRSRDDPEHTRNCRRAIASLIPTYPLLAAIAGFGSHFAIDAIPHWDCPLQSIAVSTLTTPGFTFQPGNAAVVNVQSTARFNGSIARVGINYHFGAPVVAKY